MVLDAQRIPPVEGVIPCGAVAIWTAIYFLLAGNKLRRNLFAHLDSPRKADLLRDYFNSIAAPHDKTGITDRRTECTHP